MGLGLRAVMVIEPQPILQRAPYRQRLCPEASVQYVGNNDENPGTEL